MSTLKLTVVLAFLSLVATAGCNKKQLIINASFGLVEETSSAFFAEKDTVFAAEAAPGNLMLIEGMARGAPHNPQVLLVASQMFGMYAFGFLEDCCAGEAEQQLAGQRAKEFYLRGKAYALAALQLETDFDKMLALDQMSFEKALREIDADQVPGLFWLTFNWGLYINLSRDDLSAIVDMPKVAALARRVAELDPGYYYGGAHMFLMVYYGTLGKAVGGNPEEAKSEYRKALTLSGEKFLMTKYLFAKTYCQQTMDRTLFEKTLTEIINAPEQLLPEQRLANELAKKKAIRLLEKIDDIF